MEFTPYQLIVPVVSLIMVAYAWSLVGRQRKTIWEGALWTIFWGGVAYVAFQPNSLQYLSSFTGIKKHENAATFTAIVVLFFVVFYMVIRIEALEQRLTRVVREKALKEAGINDVRDGSQNE